MTLMNYLLKESKGLEQMSTEELWNLVDIAIENATVLSSFLRDHKKELVRDDRITGKIDYTIGNHSCFYPIIKSLSSHTISVLLYNENKYGRKMTISERVSLDIKILIIEAHERYLSNSLKSTISDYLRYSDHRSTVRDFSKLPKCDPLNYDPVIPIGIGLTQPIIFEPWV